MSQDPDRLATQDFTVFTLLVKYTGNILTPDLIEALRQEFQQEMREGPTSWAFREPIQE